MFGGYRGNIRSCVEGARLFTICGECARSITVFFAYWRFKIEGG